MRAGILSDTHLSVVTKEYTELILRAFANCQIILHAGDMTHASILEVFEGKIVHAVHGNMCSFATRQQFPDRKVIQLGGYTLGLCHGAGPRHTIEERMWNLFPGVDCIIFGHTHQPLCERRGEVLFINPGSFQCTSSHGTPASYATLDITDEGLEARLHTINIF